MVKEPQMTRTNTRYDPYNSSRRAHRRRGSPPPDNWRNRAQTHQYSLDGSIYNFLEDLCMRYRGDGLHHLFREYASQSGALGQAIKAWLQFDDMRECCQSVAADLPKTLHNNLHLDYAPWPIPGDERSTSEPDTHDVRQDAGRSDGRAQLMSQIPHPHQYYEHLDIPMISKGKNLPHAPQSSGCNYLPPEGRRVANTLDSPHIHTPHPAPTASPVEDHTLPRPHDIPECVNSWDHVRCQGQKGEYRCRPSPPLPEPEAPPFTLLHYSPTSSEDMATHQTHNQTYPISITHTDLAGTGSRPLDSRLRTKRTVAAPPLVSLPPFKADAVACLGNGIRLEETGHNQQSHMFHSNESTHMAFWAMAGWTPEDGYPGWRLQSPSSLNQLKGKGRMVIQGLNEGGDLPGEQVLSGCGPPQSGTCANLSTPLTSMRPPLERTELQRDGGFIGPENSIELGLQAQDSVSTSANETTVCPAVQTTRVAHTLANYPLPSDVPVPQRKRKMQANTGATNETGQEGSRAYKRPRKARLETLLEEQQKNAREGRQNEHEQPPAQTQPRRSTRIQVMNGKKDAAPPMVENPAKPTSRKRAVRKN